MCSLTANMLFDKLGVADAIGEDVIGVGGFWGSATGFTGTSNSWGLKTVFCTGACGWLNWEAMGLAGAWN